MQLSDLTSKTPEELNVMCAELCGYKYPCQSCYNNGYKDRWRTPEDTGCVGEHDLPNYTGSWDAIMPEVRKLKGKQADTFIDFLMALTDANTGPAFCVMFRIMSATQDQLTIALILTLTSQH